MAIDAVNKVNEDAVNEEVTILRARLRGIARAPASQLEESNHEHKDLDQIE